MSGYGSPVGNSRNSYDTCTPIDGQNLYYVPSDQPGGFAETSTDFYDLASDTAERVAAAWPKHYEYNDDSWGPNYEFANGSASKPNPLEDASSIPWGEHYEQSDRSWGPEYDVKVRNRMLKMAFDPIPAALLAQQDLSANNYSFGLPPASPSLREKAHAFFCGSRTRKIVTAVTTVAGVAVVAGIVASKLLTSSSSDSQEGYQEASPDPCLNAMLGSALSNFTHTVTSLSCVNQTAAKAVALTVNKTFCSTAGAVGIFVTNTLATLGLPLVYYNRSSAPNELPPSQLTEKEIDAIVEQIENAEDDADAWCEPVSSSASPSISSPSASSSLAQSSTPQATLAPTASATSIPSTSSTTIKVPLNWVFSQASAPADTWWSVASSSSGQFLTAVQNSINGAIYCSSNYGISWSQRYTSTGNWFSVTSSASGQFLAAIQNNNGNIHRSSNYGTSWSQSSAPVSNWVSVTSSASGEFLAAVQWDSTIIYLSSNYGASWSQSSVPRGYWISVTSSSSGQFITAGQAGLGYIYLSSNYGASWSQTPTPYSDWASTTISSSGQFLAAVQINSGNVYLSSNYGASWSQSSTSASILFNPWISITSSASGEFLAAVQRNSGNIYLSSNYGANWTQSSAPVGPWHGVAMSSNGTQITAVQGPGRIWIGSLT